MPDVTVASEGSPDSHAYARFTRRVQGVLIDAIIFMVILAGALIVAVSFASDNIARILGFTVAATWLFYEPLLVSMTGGTIGHYLCNIRVVDDRGGNVGFLKAIARVAIKSFLGWYSFVAMALTSRHQAVHDLLTKSTVQIGDLAKAQTRHFAGRRNEVTGPGMPPPLAELPSSSPICSSVSRVPAGLVSRRCIDGYPCSAAELVVLSLLWLVWAGTSIGAFILGWRGQLWGARAQS
jgi:uncharacterized RDD family membrane protein YckC